jgi:hypothetical protein
MKRILFLLIVVICLVIPKSLTADDIKGYMIPEYYFAAANNNELIEGQNGFWMRRIYLGYNTNLGDGWSARLRLEMNSPAFSKDKIYPYLKNAQLQYRFKNSMKLTVGIIEPPSFNLIEKQWGYRFIEKAAPDLYKLASSRDFGISLEGGSKGIIYTLMFGNYSSNKGEDNKGKAMYGRVGYLTKKIHLELNAHIARDGFKDKFYLAGFGGVSGSDSKVGAGFYYKSETSKVGIKKDVVIISIHSIFKLSRKINGYLRYDHFLKDGLKDPGDYLTILAKGEKPRLIIAGINFKLHKMIQLSPNIKFISYGGESNLKSDFYINFTAKVSFKTKLGK